MHDDATIALLGSGAPHDFKVLSLDPPFVLGKPVHFVPAHVDVEADVSSVAGFIQDTNSSCWSATASRRSAATSPRPITA